MNCPECDQKAYTLETRTRQDRVVRRRYSCVNQHLFTTLEAILEVSETQIHPKHKAPKGRGKLGLHALWFGNNGAGSAH